MSNEELLEKIVADPEVLVGKPAIKGTRISVEFILKLLASGVSEEEVLQEYPRLAREDIRAALLYAERIIS